ncbi:MAG: ABC transporter permease, partial [Pseudomonadota bacterium]
MSALLRSYGSGLVALFFACVVGWSLMLILLPQVAMVERAVTPPTRSLDSSIARTLELDARTCINVLERYAEPEPQASDDAGAGGGLAIPSPSQMAVPSPSQMAVPSPSGMAVPSPSGMGVPSATGGSARPYILQCDRTTTGLRLSGRDGEAAFLDQVYDLPALAVAEDQTIAEQIATAERIADLADDLYARLLKIEAEGFNLTLANFAELSQPILIPMTPETRAIEDAQFFNQVFGLMGLRYVEDGEVYARIGLMTLARTLIFAVMATALALVICYPIAFKVALASGPERAKWLFLGLVIPYAIVELMRIYAWTAIIDNQGLLKSLMMWTGAVTEPVQFKRSAFTV